MHTEKKRGKKGVFQQNVHAESPSQRRIDELEEELSHAHKQIKVLQGEASDLRQKFSALSERHSTKINEWERKRIVPEYQSHAQRK